MEHYQKKIIKNYIKSYNGFDIEGMIKDLHENLLFENSTNGQVNLSTQGIKEFKKQAELAIGYFKERKQIIRKWEFNTNTVTIQVNYSAVLAIDFPNGMSAGDRINLEGSSVFEFENEQIIKIQDKS